MTPADFARLAQDAYDATPDIGVADSASRAIVRHTTAGLVVAFRGSDNEASWATDVDIETVDVPGVGSVHRGFWQAWQAISVDVLAAIDGNPVTLVGHSLGGALALMAATEMMIGGNPPAAVYGFEAPRVSPSSCVADLLAPLDIWLFRNGSDPVPELPPLWHPGAEVIQIGVNPEPWPDPADHELARVIKALSQCAEVISDGR
jgi:triacylglycerol lipase